MQEIRVIFSKTGTARYISHLDINRAMSRALCRAKIPLWFTEGFNPHPYMSFSLPLPLGIESECETMDIRIENEMPLCEIKEKLNAVLPVGLEVRDVISSFDSSDKIAYADYIFYFEFSDNALACEKIKDVLALNEIIAEKSGKKGKRKIIKEVNVKDYIKSFEVSETENGVIIKARLCAGVSKNLNPVLFCETILKYAFLDYEKKSIKRICLLKSDCSVYK